MDSSFSEMKGRRGIRDRSEEANFLPNRMKLNNNEDRSNSEPPRSFGSYLPPTSSRLKTIREKKNQEGSSDEDGELSKLNESDLDLEIPESASASVSQTPTPTLPARRINSETNLNDSKRRLSGFMGNQKTKRFCASTSELSFTSHLDTRKSLFSPKNFYGSNTSLNSTNSRLFMANSPFYSGKTMFGGASAYPKRDINQHKILRTPVQMRPSSSLSNSSNTSAKSDNIVPESNAAKRILEVMNQFSGPLKEARSMGNNINSIIKIPALVQDRKRYGDEELTLDRSIALSSPYGRPLSKIRPESPITKPLQIPTMSQLLQMKRLQNNTERVREIASRSDSFLNRNLEYKLPSASEEPTVTSSTLKMKSNITKNLLRNDKGSVNDQLPALPVNLPNIQLPELRSIPKFDIQVPASTPKVTNPPPPVVVSKPAVQFNFTSSPVTSLKEKSKTPKNDFNLSKPTPVCDDMFDSRKLNHVNEKFVLSKPIMIDDDDEEEEEEDDSDDDVVEVVAKSPVKSAFSTPATDNLFQNLVAKQKSSSWECDSCLTRNDSEKTKCLCCDTSKPGSKAAPSVGASAKVSAPAPDDLFKNLAAQQKKTNWECDACMTNNDASKDKCACCETPKPGSKTGTPSVTSVPAPKSDDLFKSLVAQQKKSQWECDACMAQNDPSKDKCACCETPKPSSTVPPSKPFGFPKPTIDDGFKKLVEKQSANWECSACMTRNEASKTKCVCCEQAKPGITASTPQFSFGSKLTSSVALPAPSEVKFSFGMPKVDASKKDEVDKPQTETIKVPEVSTVPAFTFKAPSPAPVITSSFTLKPPAQTEEKKDAPSFTFGAKPTQETEKKISFGDIPKAPEPEEPKKTEEPKKPDFGGFKFGGSVDPPTFGTSINKNGGFSFGGFGSKPAESSTGGFGSKPVEFGSKPAESSLGGFGSKPVESSTGGFGLKPAESSPAGFGSKPSESAPKVEPLKPGFSFGSSPAPTFGAPTATTTSTPATATTSFTFGSAKKENEAPKTFGSFGSPAPAFGVPSAQTAPVFGQSNTATSAFSFSAKKDEPAQPAVFSFGAKPAEPAMLFGNNQTSQIQTVTPVFGANSAPVFGTNSSNNNNESGFGSKMPSFGSANQPQKRSLDFSSAAPEIPHQTKKFDFGTQQQQASATPFQFNAQGGDSKPAFNFSATPAASFNFSNASNNSLQDQQNLFQFGANNSNSAPGIFSFTPASAPVMQFGSGTGAPTIAIPGITTFSAQGPGSSAAANQRKILRASRRTRR